MQYTQSCGIWRCLVAWPRGSDCLYFFYLFLYVFHIVLHVFHIFFLYSIFSSCIPYFLYVFHIASQVYFISSPESCNILETMRSMFFPYIFSHLFHIFVIFFQENMEMIYKLWKQYGNNVGTIWKQYGNNMRNIWGLAETDPKSAVWNPPLCFRQAA